MILVTTSNNHDPAIISVSQGICKIRASIVFLVALFLFWSFCFCFGIVFVSFCFNLRLKSWNWTNFAKTRHGRATITPKSRQKSRHHCLLWSSASLFSFFAHLLLFLLYYFLLLHLLLPLLHLLMRFSNALSADGLHRDFVGG